MAEATGVDVAAVAAKGLRAPSRLTTAEIKAVCASALTQREQMASQRRVLARYRALGKRLTTDEQVARWEALGALLFPRKAK